MTTPTKTHLTELIRQLRAKESRLIDELSETQAAITSHLKTIELIEEYEQSNAEQDS